jgi:molybdopterin-guanine dinucleotide biosynthesis protein B
MEIMIKELKSTGYRVGVIKHTPHGFDIEPDGKDTSRFSKAGADIVAAVAPNRIAFIEELPEEPELDQVRNIFENKVDIVLTEGYKTSTTTKIVVVRNGNNVERSNYNGQILTVVYSRLSPEGIPVFHPEDILEVINLLVKQLDVQTSIHECKSSGKMRHI